MIATKVFTVAICFLAGLFTPSATSATVSGVAAPDLLVSNIGDSASGGIKRYRSTDGGFVGEYLANVNVKQMAQQGDIILATDYRGGQIIRLSLIDGQSSSFGGTQLNSPQGLALGPDGKLFVSDREGIKRFDPATGEFLGLVVPVQNVLGLALGPDGKLYASGLSGVASYEPATGQLIKQISGGFWHGLTFDSAGHLYVSSTLAKSVTRFEAPGYTSSSAFTSGATINGPGGLDFSLNGDLFVVANLDNSVKRFNGSTGAFIADFIPSGSNKLFGPSSVLFLAAPAPEEPPRLQVSYNSAAKTVSLSWPRTTSIFQLVTSSALPGNWNGVSQTPTANGETFSVTLPATDAAQFFQLVEIGTP